MEIHDLCKLFPEMSVVEFDELCTDIAKNGIVDPLVTYEGKIIDGRNRHRAAMFLGCDIPTEEWDGRGGSPLAFVVSRNLHRRNLTTGQRAAIAKELEDRLKEEYRERMSVAGRRGGRIAGKHRSKRVEPKSQGVIKNDNPLSDGGHAQREAAALMNVSAGSVHSAGQIRKASPETFEAVKAGRITIPEAKRQLAAIAPAPVVAKAEPQPEPAASSPSIPVARPLDTITLTQDVDADFNRIVNTASPEYVARLGRRLIEWAELDHHAKDD